jgi:3-phenylpropionate/trans-cinnamate dioxygenase ferredoxin reductase subunit
MMWQRHRTLRSKEFVYPRFIRQGGHFERTTKHREKCHMSSDQAFVIVGASLAGAKAAETLRTEGFDGSVVLIGEETRRPYERPLLSKDYLRGEKPAAKLYVHDEGYYADNDIELITSTHVESLRPGDHEITLTGGRRMPYTRLLLSTGAAPRPLPLPGADLRGDVPARDG